MLESPPLGLYIHVPWCVRKCPYCDFNSHASKGELPERQYVEALLRDFEADREFLQGRQVETVFIGGGTPSLFHPSSYAALFSGLRTMAQFADDMECTLEANPGTVEASRFAGYREAGINRLSLGIQSFDDAQLRRLGRIHDSAQARRAIEVCRAAGFDNFNIDLMHGLPGQVAEEALEDLRRTLEFEPAHVSWYQLTIEPNTEFYSRPPVLPDEEVCFEMQVAGIGLLAASGLDRYETSAYARSGRRSRHNLNYWSFGDYIGIGAGASGKITVPQDNRILRTRKVKQPSRYLEPAGAFGAECTDVAGDQLPLEFMMNAMRLMDGFEPSLYERRTGHSFGSITKQLEYLRSLGLLDLDAQWVKPTEKGRLFVNTLLEEFL